MPAARKATATATPRKAAAKSAQARARQGEADETAISGRRQPRVAARDAVHQTPPRSGTVGRVDDHFCVRCGRGEQRDGITFRSPQAFKCVECDAETEVERKEYHARYHKARGRAQRRLAENHPAEFQDLVNDERRKLAEEAGESFVDEPADDES